MIRGLLCSIEQLPKLPHFLWAVQCSPLLPFNRCTKMTNYLLVPFLLPQLIQTPALAHLGLVMLKTTSEELACPREDLSVARKDELRKLLLDQVPAVLGLLTGENKHYFSMCNYPD